MHFSLKPIYTKLRWTDCDAPAVYNSPSLAKHICRNILIIDLVIVNRDGKKQKKTV
jgi:hypothetical protein